MKKINLLVIAFALFTLSSCDRVAPNYKGVLMENYGKSGKSDYSPVQGRVFTAWAGTELFQVPNYDKRADFEDRVLHLKASDNTEFTAKPVYSYRLMPNREVDVVFENSRLGSGKDFTKALEDNILEPAIYDQIKEESRKYLTDTLMANGGSLRFEQIVQQKVAKEFEKHGFELLVFSANLDFTEKVKDKINARNEVNTNISVIDQQIIEQRKKNELAKLETDYNQIISEGLTEEILTARFIDKWDGKSSLYGPNVPVNLMKGIK